jgi:hypothetical protein
MGEERRALDERASVRCIFGYRLLSGQRPSHRTRADSRRRLTRPKLRSRRESLIPSSPKPASGCLCTPLGALAKKEKKKWRSDSRALDMANSEAIDWTRRGLTRHIDPERMEIHTDPLAPCTPLQSQPPDACARHSERWRKKKKKSGGAIPAPLTPRGLEFGEFRGDRLDSPRLDSSHRPRTNGDPY